MIDQKRLQIDFDSDILGSLAPVHLWQDAHLACRCHVFDFGDSRVHATCQSTVLLTGKSIVTIVFCPKGHQTLEGL